MRPTSPKILRTLLTALLSKETTEKTKQFVAEVLGGMPLLKPKDLHEMARLLSRQDKIELTESIQLKI